MFFKPYVRGVIVNKDQNKNTVVETYPLKNIFAPENQRNVQIWQLTPLPKGSLQKIKTVKLGNSSQITRDPPTLANLGNLNYPPKK